MNIELVNNNERKVLDNMLQLYLHDISLYFGIEFNSNTGLYQYDSLDKYFNNSNNYPYFIKINNDIAGFILLDKVDDNMVVQEMFILNNYKNKGIGRDAIVEIFNKYKGNWIVKALPNSIKAETFWIRTIKEYTSNNCNIEYVGQYNRAVITFNNKK